MEYLHVKEGVLREKGALHTAYEISCQPKLWKETALKFYKHFYHKNDRIWEFNRFSMTKRNLMNKSFPPSLLHQGSNVKKC